MLRGSLVEIHADSMNGEVPAGLTLPSGAPISELVGRTGLVYGPAPGWNSSYLVAITGGGVWAIHDQWLRWLPEDIGARLDDARALVEELRAEESSRITPNAIKLAMLDQIACLLHWEGV